MTRDEAIKVLNEYGTLFPLDKSEAIDMAIEALERGQQRQEDIYECQYCFGEVHKNYTYCPFCGEIVEDE